MDLPAIVQSVHTWDTRGARDLRSGEEAIVVSMEPFDDGPCRMYRWTLLRIDRPGLVVLEMGERPELVMKRWLKPVI